MENVGAKLAGSLLRNGADIMVCDLDTKRVSSLRAEGAKATMQAAEVMRVCDLVITCLPSPAASDAAMCEMLPHVTKGKIWMEMSTTDEAEVKRLGSKVIAAGSLAVDCPVSGGCQSGHRKYQYFCWL